MLRLIACVLLLLALPARANLGDTVAQCVKRYGKPDSFSEASGHNPFGTLVFSAGPYQMVVFLFNTTEVGARVSKKDKTAFTHAEMNTIMSADANTSWIPIPSPDPASQEWTRADKATCIYDTAKKMLIFTAPEMVRELHALSAAPAAAAPTVPPPPPGNFVPAAPNAWAPPTPPLTNAAPATNTAPATP